MYAIEYLFCLKTKLQETKQKNWSYIPVSCCKPAGPTESANFGSPNSGPLTTCGSYVYSPTWLPTVQVGHQPLLCGLHTSKIKIASHHVITPKAQIRTLPNVIFTIRSCLHFPSPPTKFSRWSSASCRQIMMDTQRQTDRHGVTASGLWWKCTHGCRVWIVSVTARA